MDSREPLPSLFAELTDARNLVVDNREIDEQTTGPNKNLDLILSRELVVRGNAMFRQAENTNHGLRRIQLSLSTTKRGECVRLVETTSNDEEAVPLTFTRFNIPVTKYFKRQELPTREQVEDFVNGLSEDVLVNLRRKYGALNRTQLVNHIAHQGRPDRIIEAAALYVSGFDYLDTMSPEDVVDYLEMFTMVTKLIQSGVTPNESDVETLQDMKAILKIPFGEIFDHLKQLASSHAHRAEILGTDHMDASSERPYDPEPTIPANWGVPDELLPHLRSRATWEQYISQGIIDPKTKTVEFSTAWSRSRINEASRKLGTFNFLEYNALQANDPPSWEEMREAVLRVEATYAQEMEDWSNRLRGDVQWTNLGKVVESLTSWDDGIWNSLDEAPGDAYFMNPEQEYVEGRLMGGTTPDPLTLWMGDCGPFAESLPISTRKDANGDYIVGGHPMAEFIFDFMTELRTPRDPVNLGLLDDSTVMGRIIVSTKMPIKEVEFKGRMCNLITFDPELDELEEPIEGTGIPVLLDMSTAIPLDPEVRKSCESFSVMARVYHPHPGPAVTHGLRKWDPESEQSVIASEKDPFLRYYMDEDGNIDEDRVPESLTFLSKPSYLSYLLPVLRVPTIGEVEVEDDDGYNESVPGIVWKECRKVFPALCRWAKKAAAAYTEGDMELMDFWETTGLEKAAKDGRGQMFYVNPPKDLLEEVYAELANYQRVSIKRLALMNIGIIAPLYHEFNDILVAAVRTPDLLQGYNWSDGEQTCYGYYFGRGGLLWETLSRLQGTHNDILLPQEAQTNMKLVWRALGYDVNSSRGLKDKRVLERMIERFYWRTNAASPRRWTIQGRRRTVPALHNLDAGLTAFSNGLLGDQVARVMNVLYPLEIPGLPNLFVPSEEELEAGGSWENALRLHVMNSIPVEFWGRETQQRAVKLVLGWGRRKELGGPDMKQRALLMFINALFPEVPKKKLFLNPRNLLPSKEDEQEGVTAEDIANELFENLQARTKEQNRNNLTKRLLVRSSLPVAASKVLAATASIDALQAFGVQKMQRILKNASEQLGPATHLIVQNINKLTK